MGRIEVEDLLRSGRPATTRTNKNIARITATLKEDHHSSCQLLSEQSGIPKTIVRQILYDNMVVAEFFLLHGNTPLHNATKTKRFWPNKVSQSSPIRYTHRI